MAQGVIAFVFPGQGSQSVGMGKSWAKAHPLARKVFEEASDTLDFDVAKLCWKGPEEELQLTANLQPALLTVSTAIHRVVADSGVQPAAMAGHSLGEYSALVAAGALEFGDALRLVRRRGQLMQQSVPLGEGAMAAIIGMSPDVVAAVANQASSEGICTIANYNSPDQTVIAGHTHSVERAVELARIAGAKRALMLPVSAPFHSPLMSPAREGLAPELEAVAFADPQVPVVTNADAIPETTAAGLRKALIRQIDQPVRWVESVFAMRRKLGVDLFVELGPGNVLAGLIRRTGEGPRPLSINEPKHLEQLAGLAAGAARRGKK